jgi:hypothetical protein
MDPVVVMTTTWRSGDPVVNFAAAAMDSSPVMQIRPSYTVPDSLSPECSPLIRNGGGS